MMGMKTVKRMASELLDVGESRVYFDPSRLSDIEKAVTKDDIRKLINENAISAKRKKGVPRIRGRIRGKKKRLRSVGLGKRKGRVSAKEKRKSIWMKRIRAQRALLRELKEKRVLMSGYRIIYKMIKGGEFKDKSHMLTYLKERGHIK